MTLHDWIHFPPLTNIRDIEQQSSFTGRIINSATFFMIVFIPLLLTVRYTPPYSFHVKTALLGFYGLLTLGTIMSWWVPYFFGGYSESYKAHFAEYNNTHHFLPARGSNIVPNTFHVIMHLVIWACFGISLYLTTS